MKEVLLLGDSIRMFYQDNVRALLGENWHVTAPEENCRFAAYTLNSLRMWLQPDYKPDVIHWNNGLWDLGVVYAEDGCFTPLDNYLDSLSKIIRELKKYGVPVIFATTTPVSPKKETVTTHMPACVHRTDVIRYNTAALKLMKSEGVLIDDLFSIVDGHTDELICDDLTHPNELGKQVLAQSVVRSIREAVGEP